MYQSLEKIHTVNLGQYLKCKHDVYSNEILNLRDINLSYPHKLYQHEEKTTVIIRQLSKYTYTYLNNAKGNLNVNVHELTQPSATVKQNTPTTTVP